ncbi:MAG: lamin tail domain-containing protein [Pyrinomonadaceae bacterium]
MQQDAPDALLLVENFDYPAGSLLTANGWTAHSGAGTNPLAVSAPGLAYPGYPQSDIGNAVRTATSGEDANKSFGAQTTGTVYAGVIVNVSDAVVDPLDVGGYFFHLGPDPIGTSFRGRIYVKKNASNAIAFGITKASTSVAADIAYTGFNYALNTNYLLVMKYTIVDGAANDTVSLIINPALPGTEPAATVTAPDSGASDINPGTVAIRQGSTATAPTVAVDAIRVGQSWEDIMGSGPTPTPTTTPSLTPTPTATPTGTPTMTPSPSPVGAAGVVISQVYGGGGNAGAPLTNDYVELYNAGSTTVDLSTWSVQYSGPTGTGTWQVTPLTGSIAPGHYFLVQEAAGATTSGSLPTPDVIGTIAMGSIAGKVALLRDQVAQAGACPSGAVVADVVGYGITANCFEGTAPAPAPSNTTSDLRGDGGCIDTNNNNADFATAAPDPRNSASTHACGGATPTPTATFTPTGTPTATPTGTPTVTPTPSPVGTPGVRVSQVYGGGGNAGAPLTNDYIELFNAGASTVDLSTWSVQYSGATGTGTWQVTALSGSIAPGHYYLIQEAAGATTSGSLPPPDAVGTIAMGGTAGKVVLVSDQVAQAGACPSGTSVVDLVGYGITANCFEGAGPAPAPSNTMSDFRLNSGCLDTNNNSTDLEIGEPTPRNSASPANTCGGPSPTPTPKTLFDYDGDRKSDISVYRPSAGNWYLQRSTAGFYGVSFGNSTDRIAPADYDGDGKTDIAVYRPSTGVWYITYSSNGTVVYYVFGLPEDLPTPADYDGDGRADVSVFRPSSGTWYRLNSSNGGFVAIQFGANGDRPTLGDFDGDRKADVAIFRPSTGAWYQMFSSNGSFFGEAFGISTDKIAQADYDGDGKTDIAIYRPSESLWYVKRSATGTYVPYVFGLAQDIPVPADFDGDGKADIGVFRPSDGTWYIVKSTNGGYIIYQFGQNGDRPTQNAFGG